MAFMKTAICFSFALFILAASAAGSPFCDTANNKALCAELVKGAKTWPEAMTNALKGALQKAKAGKAIADRVGSKLPGDLKPQTKESLAGTCREAYENILDNINQCIGFVKNDPFSSLRTYLSASSFSDCTDGLEEFGVSLPEVSQFADEMLSLSSTLLAVAQKKP